MVTTMTIMSHVVSYLAFALVRSSHLKALWPALKPTSQTVLMEGSDAILRCQLTDNAKPQKNNVRRLSRGCHHIFTLFGLESKMAASISMKTS